MVAERTNVKITVSLDQEQIDKLSVGADPVQKLSGTATYLLSQMANGAMLIQPETVARMDVAAGKRLSEEDLPLLLGEATHQDGRVEVRWRIDPINLQSLDDLVKAAGMDRQEYIQQFFDWAMDQGWLWNYTPDNQIRLALTLEQKRKLESILEVKALTGDDLYKFITEIAEEPVKFKE